MSKLQEELNKLTVLDCENQLIGKTIVHMDIMNSYENTIITADRCILMYNFDTEDYYADTFTRETIIDNIIKGHSIMKTLTELGFISDDAVEEAKSELARKKQANSERQKQQRYEQYKKLQQEFGQGE